MHKSGGIMQVSKSSVKSDLNQFVKHSLFLVNCFEISHMSWIIHVFKLGLSACIDCYTSSLKKNFAVFFFQVNTNVLPLDQISQISL